MKFSVQRLLLVAATLLSVGWLSAFYTGNYAYKSVSKLPYQKAGLSQRQAAAHLLSRFTYGAKPGEVDEVVHMGLEKWLQQQLDAKQSEESLNALIDTFDVTKMSNEQIVAKYPRGGYLTRMAVRDGAINKDSVKTDKKEYRDALKKYMDQKGLASERDLFAQFINQKVLRAAYSRNQLQEVLTDFWFNHFNVSITKNPCAAYIPAYERDVIRPNVFGHFDDLLMATAKSPAMLVYLDNYISSGAKDNQQANYTALQKKMSQQYRKNNMMDTTKMSNQLRKRLADSKKAQGLNENYAREVMELHTLGVDGGYTQQDVTQAARVLTGWTLYPIEDYGYVGSMRKLLAKTSPEQLAQRGFVHEGDFLFVPTRHDVGEKVVLGKHFGPNGGYQEGVQLLDMLAHHPSTAKFISRKLAVRFVSDNPPQSLIDKMAKTFLEKDGSIRDVIITMVESPEFWSPAAVREKTKSPFELAMGAVRSLNATVTAPYQLYNWVNRMGEKKYFYQAPTGFPDRGQYWINTGALLNRMNFGLALASGRIPGVKVDLAALNNHHEPESSQAALVTYSKLIMPERDLTETIKRLTPMLNDPELMQKVENASAKMQPANTGNDMQANMAMMEPKERKAVYKSLKGKNNAYMAMQSSGGNNGMLSQVVGVIIGSPEYQRR